MAFTELFLDLADLSPRSLHSPPSTYLQLLVCLRYTGLRTHLINAQTVQTSSSKLGGTCKAFSSSALCIPGSSQASMGPAFCQIWAPCLAQLQGYLRQRQLKSCVSREFCQVAGWALTGRGWNGWPVSRKYGQMLSRSLYIFWVRQGQFLPFGDLEQISDLGRSSFTIRTKGTACPSPGTFSPQKPVSTTRAKSRTKEIAKWKKGRDCDLVWNIGGRRLLGCCGTCLATLTSRD